MTYREARVYLDEMSKYGSVLCLDAVRGLLRELGDPQDDLKFIHIAGTNGKGSVLAYTSSVLSEAGYRTGRYVSPTVVSYLERIQINGKWIPEERFAQLTEAVREAVARLEAAKEPLPTVFEAETAIAFLYFKEEGCDLVVLEAGLGGALDATNIVKNTVCAVFSSISRDHIGVIGDTVEEIAENKAGIIKPGCRVISGAQSSPVTAILSRRAGELACPFAQARPELVIVQTEDASGTRMDYKGYKDISSPLAGKYQKDNLALCLEVVDGLRDMGYVIPDPAVRAGIAAARWPGRFERIREKPLVILDGAHNEAAALRLEESVRSFFPGRRLFLIMGVFRDKEYRRIAEILCPLAEMVCTVTLPDRGRSLRAEELAEAAAPFCPAVRACGSIRQAVRTAAEEAEDEDVILVCGSLSYLSEARSELENVYEDTTGR